MAFKPFLAKRNTFAYGHQFRPSIAISNAEKGKIMFNIPFLHIYFAKTGTQALFYFDEETKLAAIKPVTDNSASYTLHKGNYFSALPVARKMLELGYPEKVRFSIRQEEDLLIIEKPSPQNE